MCGIVGYVGGGSAVSAVLEGLRRLEYRGYDSAGVAVVDRRGVLHVRRSAGKLENLERLIQEQPVDGCVAIGHTRWATHGPPCTRNAHPHSSSDGSVVVVHNGIVENFASLRGRLEARGYVFGSDTDTEVIAHQIHFYLREEDCVERAFRRALGDLEGPSAVVVLCREDPAHIYAARLGNAGGLVIGHGEGETLVSSDVPAIVHHTRRVTFLEDRQMAVISANDVRVQDLEGRPVHCEPITIPWDPVSAAKGAYRHFMQKEIYEQGRSLADTLRGRVDLACGSVILDGLNLDAGRVRRLKKIVIVACGTSYYAGLVGKFMIERLVGLPVEVDYGSEYRYREPILDPDHLVLAITQSGETADTLAALDVARRQHCFTAAIVNVVGSQAARMCDGVIYMQCGPEIGVASTKAFTASLVDLCLLAIHLGQMRGTLGQRRCAKLLKAVSRLPGLAGTLLAEGERGTLYRDLAERFHTCRNALYLGRGINYPVALEGALKLKEISYIHAEGYPAGEMKHGPIALIDDKMPIVVVALRDVVYEKMLGQIEQVKARHGIVIAVAHQGDAHVAARADHVLPIPATHPLLAPVLAVMPLQLLAYEMAVRLGADVDQPRNLAKSVTVE